MRVMALAGIVGMIALSAGCASEDGSCEDLAPICASCPDTPDGNTARTSCEFAVEQADELACEDRLDRDVYAEFGCNAS